MLDLVSEISAPRAETSPRPVAKAGEPDSFLFPSEWPVRALAAGDVLYKLGDAKTHILRVETGIVSVTAPRPDGPPEIVELAFPGSFLGLGFLKHHIHNASAVVDSSVSLWPLEALDPLLEQSSEARQRQAQATEIEFAHRRAELEASTAGSPSLRLCAFLLAVSRLNQLEGRNPLVIEERPHSGEVAEFLRMDIETLAGALKDMERRRLVAHDGSGRLLLLDPSAMEALVG
jgi:CRP/FNR family transcriptional regulator